ncbi:hypothetical protein [Phyllobacterium myrsinacearum]|uniref:Uncharacterized protein n=1 Tax=Phyllobacterium myrsinacearum TaxID=28101 RepID=A0A839EZ51_9HYPH|nr:hypothetical protein [Phyllobacterium myrsinacearum]MBA8881740.1 hypothetical protein [Phyllobacterium myrsinacearum]
MIVQHTDEGFITNIMFDPVPDEIVQAMTNKNIKFINIKGTPLPPEQLLHPISGEMVVDELGEPIFQSPGLRDVIIDLSHDYVFDGAITPRPIFEAPDIIHIKADGVDMQVVENLPEGATLIVDGKIHMLEGTSLTISSDMPAQYDILIQKFPYLDRTIRVVADAA